MNALQMIWQSRILHATIIRGTLIALVAIYGFFIWYAVGMAMGESSLVILAAIVLLVLALAAFIGLFWFKNFGRIAFVLLVIWQIGEQIRTWVQGSSFFYLRDIQSKGAADSVRLFVLTVGQMEGMLILFLALAYLFLSPARNLFKKESIRTHNQSSHPIAPQQSGSIEQ